MKKYKLPEENLESAMVQEPAAAYPRMNGRDTAVLARDNYGVAETEEEEFELPDSPNFAHNAEELEQAIMEVEAHWEDPDYWISWEEMDKRLKEKYPWLK